VAYNTGLSWAHKVGGAC